MSKLVLIFMGLTALNACAPKISTPMEAFQYKELSYAEAINIFPDFPIAESEYGDAPIAELRGKLDFLDPEKGYQFSIRANTYCVRGVFLNWGEQRIDPAPYDGHEVILYGGMEGGSGTFQNPESSISFGGAPASRTAPDVPDCDDFFAAFMGVKIAVEEDRW